MGRGRPENFKPRSTVEARKNGKKGGLKSGESRRKKKLLRELLEIALAMKDDDGRTEAENVVAALVREAKGGNVKAFEAIQSTIGEKPKEEVAQDVTMRISWKT